MILFRLLTLIVLCFSTIDLNAITPKDVVITPHEKNRKDKRKGKVAICAMFQNEATFLKEWIEYHRLIGVSHFYLYNNNSTDGYLAVLKPYLEEGIVELFNVPFDSTVFRDFAKTHNTVQICCYDHAIAMSAKANTWLAIIDSDEFIALASSIDLPTFLKRYKMVGGVVAYWQVYGTSNVWDILPGELMLEKLVNKFPQDYDENWQFKSIVRPKYARCHSPHSCRFSDDRVAVTQDFKRFKHGKPYPHIPVDKIRINHYTFRTEKFYNEVKKPRRAIWGYVPSPELEKDRMNLSNSVHDPIMLRHVSELKKRMFKN